MPSASNGRRLRVSTISSHSKGPNEFLEPVYLNSRSRPELDRTARQPQLVGGEGGGPTQAEGGRGFADREKKRPAMNKTVRAQPGRAHTLQHGGIPFARGGAPPAAWNG